MPPRSARGDHSMSTPNRRSVLAGVASLAGAAFLPFGARAQEVDASEIYGPVAGEPFPVRGIDLSRVNPRFLRTLVDYPTDQPVGTIVIDPAHHFLYLVIDERTGDPLRRRRRTAGLSVVRDGIDRSQTRMAGLVPAEGDVRAAARDRQRDVEAAERHRHARRHRQPARGARHVSLQGRQGHALSHPWHDRTLYDRHQRLVGLHPHDQPGRARPLPACRCRAPRSSCSAMRSPRTRSRRTGAGRSPAPESPDQAGVPADPRPVYDPAQDPDQAY